MLLHTDWYTLAAYSTAAGSCCIQPTTRTRTRWAALRRGGPAREPACAFDIKTRIYTTNSDRRFDPALPLEGLVQVQDVMYKCFIKKPPPYPPSRAETIRLLLQQNLRLDGAVVAVKWRSRLTTLSRNTPYTEGRGSIVQYKYHI